jgi:hypothetical protein
MIKALHLDSEYSRHWQEYYTSDGKMYDSRFVNWRQVDWEKVVRIDTNIKGNNHSINCNHSSFLFFMCFRWGGKHNKKPIHIWTTGWTDGIKCFLTDIDFHTGIVIRNYESRLSNFNSHIHPRCLPIINKTPLIIY